MIAAPATPRGLSALAVVRISGEGSGALVEVLMGLDRGELARGRLRRVGELSGPKGRVDSVVAIYWREGSSYTGEEMVEIICHGSPARVDGVMEALVDGGARPAQAGEFTRRALLSGRMSPLEVMDLAATLEEGDRRRAPEVAGGAMKAWRAVEGLQELLEGAIEFEDRHGLEEADTDARAADIAEMMGSLVEAAERAQSARRVAVMGPPNSGKSSLVNELAGYQVALVDEEAGTTRDGASAEVELDGVRLRVVDTAGETSEGLDGMAYRLAADSIGENTVVIWMESVAEPKPPASIEGRAGTVVAVSSRADLYAGGENRISIVTGEGVDGLKRRLIAWASQGSVAALLRHMESTARNVHEIIVAGDLAAAAEETEELRRQMRSLIDGKGAEVELAVERALGRLCVGK